VPSDADEATSDNRIKKNITAFTVVSCMSHHQPQTGYSAKFARNGLMKQNRMPMIHILCANFALKRRRPSLDDAMQSINRFCIGASSLLARETKFFICSDSEVLSIGLLYQEADRNTDLHGTLIIMLFVFRLILH